jgi:hypothetical protein
MVTTVLVGAQDITLKLSIRANGPQKFYWNGNVCVVTFPTMNDAMDYLQAAIRPAYGWSV